MATTAQSIVTSAQILLNDVAGDRWPASELVAHLNEFQRQCIRVRPDQSASILTIALVAGPKQALPDTAAYLIDISSNANYAPVSKVDMALMDSILPAWRTKPQSATIIHFMHDLKDPRVFWVYPPAKDGAGGASVLIEASMKPVDAVATGATTVTGNLSVQDDMGTAAFNWVMFRALSKNAEHANQINLASGYKAAHDTALGIESQVAAAPKTGEN